MTLIIGLVLHAQALAFDASNVLVVYNPATDGQVIADHYQSVHPDVSSFALTTSTNEQIDAATYLSEIRAPLLAEINRLKYEENIDIDVIVTTRGLPLRIDAGTAPSDFYGEWERYSSLESELTTMEDFDEAVEMGNQTYNWLYPNYNPRVLNPYYNHTGDFEYDNYGTRLASRLDAFDADTVIDMIDRAQNAYVVSDGSVVVIDDDPSAGSDQMYEADANNNSPGPGLVSVLDAQQQAYLYENTDAAIVQTDLPVIGYVSHGVNDGDGGLDPGYVSDQLDLNLSDGATFFTHESYNAVSFDPANRLLGQALLGDWFEAGGTAGVGHVEEPVGAWQNVLNEDLFYDRMLTVADEEDGIPVGMTFAEAAWGALLQNSFVNTVVGDPLMRWRFVQKGDMNLDGVVDGLDLDPYILALTDLDQYGQLYGGVDPSILGDFTNDGHFNLLDTDGFVAALTGQLYTPVPEPGSATIALGAIALALRGRRV